MQTMTWLNGRIFELVFVDCWLDWSSITVHPCVGDSLEECQDHRQDLEIASIDLLQPITFSPLPPTSHDELLQCRKQMTLSQCPMARKWSQSILKLTTLRTANQQLLFYKTTRSKTNPNHFDCYKRPIKWNQTSLKQNDKSDAWRIDRCQFDWWSEESVMIIPSTL